MPLDRIEVVASASRVEEPIAQVPVHASVIGREEIFESFGVDLRSLLRYEPGVSVEASPLRFGLGNVAIRGLDGNRVQMTLDGIRLPESYRVGSFSNASRNALGLGLLRRVEIVRGPASAVHGSDALAGVLAFTTVEPRDYLPPAKRLGGEAFASYAAADRSLGGGAVVAAQAGSSRLLAGYELREGKETGNRGDVGGTGQLRTEPNPQDTRTASHLLKWSAPLGSRWVGGLAFDRFSREVATNVLSLNPQSPRTVSLTGDDRARRSRASADLEGYDVGPFSRIKATAYWQESKTVQDTDEVRANTTATCLSAPGTVTCEREARFRFQQRETGLVAIGEAGARWLGAEHSLVVGAELARIDLEESRDGRQTDLATGAVSSVVGGEQLPTRDFPNTRSERLAVFAQDRFALPGSALTFIPGLRVDRFRLEPRRDELFRVNRPVVGLGETAWSPRFGLLARVSDRWTLTGQASAGFRAPPAADLNLGLSSLPAGFAVVANPDLRSERSRGLELGARFKGSALEASASLFHTRYTDLILSRAPLACPSDPACVPGATGTFQSQNVAAARIYGFEARGEWRFLRHAVARLAYAHLRGDDLQKHVPLNSIEPPRLVAGLAWERTDFGIAAHVSHSARQRRADLSTGLRFVPPPWTSVDLTARWNVTPAIEINLGVFNALDRKYWQWSDVRGLTTIATGFDRYTQPGRNVALGMRMRF